MKALFVGPINCRELEIYSNAWDFWNEPSTQVTYNVVGDPCDESVREAARSGSQDVIFYIGGAGGSGLPSVETFQVLRRYAKTIHLVCDSADSPWWPFLLEYREMECFDLQVGLDGPLHAPVDLATLPPINPALYDGPQPARHVRCGFAGQFIKKTHRGKTVKQLIDRGVLTHVKRAIAEDNKDINPYSYYVNFLKSCKIAFNHAFTSFDQEPTVKWRVLEAALAGCALLENESLPFVYWFPKGAAFHYKDAFDAEGIIRYRSGDEIENAARILSSKVRTDYTPQKIYGEMLSRVGL